MNNHPLHFTKYTATGNDFLLFDNREGVLDPEDKTFWAKLCHRRWGAGADGILFLEKDPSLDFRMRYLNADGGEVSMCANGARSLAHYAWMLGDHAGGKEKAFKFRTQKGEYQALVNKSGMVQLSMPELYEVGRYPLEEDLFSSFPLRLYLNTGVPHVVLFVENLDKYPVEEKGKEIRLHSFWAPESGNVNFVQVLGENHLKIRTFERGVEGETLSCGTGVVASAFAYYQFHRELLGEAKEGEEEDENGESENKIEVETPGGSLTVSYLGDDFENVTLKGEVIAVYQGQTLPQG